MSTSYAGRRRIDNDHFHPEGAEDPAAQRRMRGALEQIDYTAFACSREVVGKVIGRATPAAFQALALATANARAAWVAAAFKVAGAPVNLDVARRLADLRSVYEELSDAYEGARRMVERGYLAYEGSPSA